MQYRHILWCLVVLALLVTGCPKKKDTSAQLEAIDTAEISTLSIPDHLKSADVIGTGLVHFKVRCSGCHGFKAEGTYKGPSLQGALQHSNGDFSELAHIISDGIPEGGMPGWGKKLVPQDIEKIAAYLVFMRQSIQSQ